MTNSTVGVRVEDPAETPRLLMFSSRVRSF